MREDLKALPDELRATRREAEQKLQETAEEHPVVREALDLRILLAAALGALVIAFVLRLAGLGFAISLLVFLVLFVGGWLGISRAAAPRRSNRPARS
jgi:Flp pilus assembly protein TadB